MTGRGRVRVRGVLFTLLAAYALWACVAAAGSAGNGAGVMETVAGVSFVVGIACVGLVPSVLIRRLCPASDLGAVLLVVVAIGQAGWAWWVTTFVVVLSGGLGGHLDAGSVALHYGVALATLLGLWAVEDVLARRRAISSAGTGRLR